MTLTRSVILAATFLGWCCGATALGADLVATFDSFEEGPVGVQFNDGGITFSDLDVALENPPFQFIVDDASQDPWLPVSLPNVLTSTGHVPGPGHGTSRFQSMTMTFPGIANGASIDVFAALHGDDKLLTLTALLNDVSVATSSILLSQGTVVRPGFGYLAFSIDAPQFDKLTLLAATPNGTPDYALAAFDNVRVRLIPEAGSLFMLLSAVVGLSLTWRGRSGVWDS